VKRCTNACFDSLNVILGGMGLKKSLDEFIVRGESSLDYV
jgi:hypothetical protein